MYGPALRSEQCISDPGACSYDCRAFSLPCSTNTIGTPTGWFTFQVTSSRNRFLTTVANVTLVERLTVPLESLPGVCTAGAVQRNIYIYFFEVFLHRHYQLVVGFIPRLSGRHEAPQQFVGAGPHDRQQNSI